MDRVDLKIAGMSCDHCVRAVTRTLAALAGVRVERVAVGAATVSHEPAMTSVDQIREALSDAGYAAKPASQMTGDSP
ncbi:MAG: heavy-metal-associated domain-containing protein [Gemmatimonadaceae bacterium]